MAVGGSVAVEPWSGMLEELLSRVAGRFPRVEPRRRIPWFVLGLLADLPRKNCWTIAEHAGEASPDGMQHLLARAVWDTDGVRDDLREFVVEHLGDPGAVLVVDETGDVTKGTATVGTQRQYTGTAGRVENAQVAVYLTYAGQAGHAMIERELYLPKSWTIDPQRCAGAGIPADVEFATKPALAGGNDHSRARYWGAGAVSGRRRGLRRRPGAAHAAGGPPSRLRPGHRWRPPGAHRGRTDAPATLWPPPCPRVPGSGSPLARGLRDSATTTGRGSPWPPRPDTTGYSPAATPVTVNSPAIAATPRPWFRSVSWSASPDAVGPLRKVFRLARAWPDSMSTRSAAGWPGGAGPCSRCSPTPYSRSSPQPNAPHTRLSQN